MDAVPQCPPVQPRNPSSALIASWLDGWSAAANGFAECMVATFTGRIDSFDIPRWLELTSSRRPPSWTSPHEVVFETPIARLRDFSTARPQGLVPTLVLPPQAGHSSCIVDYSTQQSQIRAILGAGLTRALSLDWIGATPETATASIDDYLEVVDRAVGHCGGRVNLIGDCQGGWLATIYTALNPERVNTLTLAGAPIDFHAGEPVIHEVLRRLSPGGDLRLLRGGGGRGRGRIQGQAHALGIHRDQARR